MNDKLLFLVTIVHIAVDKLTHDEFDLRSIDVVIVDCFGRPCLVLVSETFHHFSSNIVHVRICYILDIVHRVFPAVRHAYVSFDVERAITFACECTTYAMVNRLLDVFRNDMIESTVETRRHHFLAFDAHALLRRRRLVHANDVG